MGCKPAKEETKGENSPRSNATLTENFVDTMRLSRRDFRHQTVCNGVLRAGVKSRLATRHPDVITEVRGKDRATRRERGAACRYGGGEVYPRFGEGEA